MFAKLPFWTFGRRLKEDQSMFVSVCVCDEHFILRAIFILYYILSLILPLHFTTSIGNINNQSLFKVHLIRNFWSRESPIKWQLLENVCGSFQLESKRAKGQNFFQTGISLLTNFTFPHQISHPFNLLLLPGKKREKFQLFFSQSAAFFPSLYPVCFRSSPFVATNSFAHLLSLLHWLINCAALSNGGTKFKWVLQFSPILDAD